MPSEVIAAINFLYMPDGGASTVGAFAAVPGKVI